MNTALLLLDLQRGLLASDKIKFADPRMPDVTLAAARSLLGHARASKMPVVHVGVVRAQARGALDLMRTQSAKASGKVPRDVLQMAAGSSDVQFLLDVAEGEDVIHKMGVSALQGTALDAVLRHRGIDSLILCGAFTHMVVDSTARQAFDLGYAVTVASDACCAPALAPHENALTTSIPNFAVVTTSAEIIAASRAVG